MPKDNSVVDSFTSLYVANMQQLTDNVSTTVNNARAAAIEEFAQLGIPTKGNERYKYTDLKPFFEQEFAFSFAPEPSVLSANDLKKCSVPDLDAYRAMVVNGVYVGESLTELDNGVVYGSFAAASKKYGHLFEQYYNTLAEKATDGAVALNTAFARDGFFVYVPKNKQLDKPIQIVNAITSTDLMVQPRNLIIADENAEAKIVVCNCTTSDSKSLYNAVTEVILGENASIETATVQNQNLKSYGVDSVLVRQTRYSRYRNCTVALNGGLIRNNMVAKLDGEECENRLAGLYLVDKDQHVDFYTRVEHNVPRCFSNQLFKGVVDDNGVAAFNGMVYVAPDAQKTEAFQTNRTLQLTNEAKIYTKPQLEIYADDVKCSHGATVGQPDTEQVFYMRSRGIGEREAVLLQMFGFAHEVVEHIGIEALREQLGELVDKRLRGEL